MANKVKHTMKEKNNSTIQGIMGIFVFIMMCVFPVVYHNYYFDILETKYQFYCVVAIGMAGVMALYGLFSGSLQEYIKQISVSRLVKEMSVADWAMIAFWLSNVISWLFSDWKWDSFWGTEGRYNGVFLITVYMVAYFMVTRFFELKRWYLDALLVVSLFVCLFGISDYFQMDLLGFKVNMVDKQKPIYTSTFGNINTYTVYVGMVLGVAMMFLAEAKNWKRGLWYYCTMAVSMVALIISTSDNAYLMLAVIFGLSPLYLFRTRTGMQRYMLSVSTFLLAVHFVAWINVVFADKVLGIKSMFTIISELSFLLKITLGCWILTGILTVLEYKKVDCKWPGKLWVGLWVCVIVLVVSFVGYAFYDVNVKGNVDGYSVLNGYLLFNENWGSSRGYVWMNAVKLYKHVLTPFQKLFGYGPDTFQLLMMQYFPPRYNVVYDSAHNEYLHHLLTIGVVGMMSYIVFIFATIVQMIKNVKNRPEIAAILLAIMAYVFQALVNINLPVIMPLVLTLWSMGVSRKGVSTEEKEN